MESNVPISVPVMPVQCQRKLEETWVWVRGSPDRVEEPDDGLTFAELCREYGDIRWATEAATEPGVLFPSIIIRRTEQYGEVIRHGSNGAFDPVDNDRAFEPPPPYTTSSPASLTGRARVRAIANKVYSWLPLKEVTTMAVGSAALGAQLPLLSTKGLFSPGIGPLRGGGGQYR
ncbi:hypothetical protein BC832DRAFT_538395 [Gaertneriomyces semiglobifer]|nr:hypothetical protein BC832DRAFT_538395 [Gaertneriomyces semiglobifer]